MQDIPSGRDTEDAWGGKNFMKNLLSLETKFNKHPVQFNLINNISLRF